MAISKQQKEEILNQYKDWLDQSEAALLVEYTGTSMKEMEMIRAKVRETGGEFHVVKNTLIKRALDAAEREIPDGLLEQSTAIGFAFSNVPSTAKALADAAKEVNAIKFKGGYMGSAFLTPENVKALADLPPLPVVQAQLLGVLQVPAGKLVRTIIEPARSLAAVFKAYSEKAEAAA